jgi:hypothetical protein
MEKRRFELLSTWLGKSDSRRSTLRALGAGVFATGLGHLGPAESLAKKKKKPLGARCKKSGDCKGKLNCKSANSQNSCYDQTKKRCCKKEGATCNDSCECCGVDVICNGHMCQSA